MTTSRTRFVVGFSVLLLSALTGCVSFGGAPIGEVIELVTEGGTKPLREELRPIRGSTRVLVFALDGVGQEDLQMVLDARRMPRTSALLGPRTEAPNVYGHAYAAPNVLSTLPSSTIASWTSIFTGAPPAETGVPGNEWWARRERRLYAPAPLSLNSNSQAIRVYTDGLLDEVVRMPTLFEMVDLRSHVAMLHIHRGADLLQLAELAQFGDLFEASVGAALGGGLGNPDTYRETDQTAVASLLSDLEGNGVPDLQIVYLGGIDLITHQAETPIERQHRYLEEVVDPLIGSVLDAYGRFGALEDTYVLFVSDHGYTPVLGDDLHALGMEGDDEPPAVLEGAGFRVRPFAFEVDREDFQAVLAYQGALANVYLADRSTCAGEGTRCDWNRPPRYREDVLVAARAFFDASEAGMHVPEMRGTLDLVLAREPVEPGESTRPFEIFDGERLTPVAEFLRENPRPDLLRLDERLRQLGEGPLGHRAGDVVLLTRWGTHRPIEQRFYFGPEGFHSHHGGATAEDGRVPFILAHPSRPGVELRDLVQELAGAEPFNFILTPLVRALLLGEALETAAGR